MVISDIIICKNKIMNELISIEDVYKMINNKDISSPDKMKEVNIFSRMKVPNTTLKAKNYICFNYSEKILNANKVLKNIFINIAVVCHESEIITPYGNRHDLLGGIVLDAFNWSDFLGFQLELIGDDEGIINNEYYSRTLQFKNIAKNDICSR